MMLARNVVVILVLGVAQAQAQDRTLFESKAPVFVGQPWADAERALRSASSECQARRLGGLAILSCPVQVDLGGFKTTSIQVESRGMARVDRVWLKAFSEKECGEGSTSRRRKEVLRAFHNLLSAPWERHRVDPVFTIGFRLSATIPGDKDIEVACSSATALSVSITDAWLRLPTGQKGPGFCNGNVGCYVDSYLTGLASAASVTGLDSDDSRQAATLALDDVRKALKRARAHESELSLRSREAFSEYATQVLAPGWFLAEYDRQRQAQAQQ